MSAQSGFGVFLSPPRILYGAGAVAGVGAEAARLGSKALVVTGRGSTLKNGSLDAVCASLAAAGLGVAPFPRVEPDPSVETVEVGVALARAEGCDVIVALGGGSPIDAAKAISLLLANPGRVQDFAAKPATKAGPPIVAIPTTAGTGSEVTRVDVITDVAAKKKMPIFGDMLVPAVAVLDPELTVSMPPHVTAATGMDALTHAMEAYLSRKANPFTDPLALAAIAAIAEHLPVAVAQPGDLRAREAMLLAQLQAGLAFSNASVGLVHSMSRPLGAYFGVPHGAANALLLADVLEFLLPDCVERMARMAVAMGVDVTGLEERAAAKAAVGATRSLFGLMGLPERLGPLGVTEEAIPDMARDALASPSTPLCPRVPTQAEVEGLYRGLM